MFSEAEERIEINPNVCHGKPVVRGTRIMVANILSLLAGGYDVAKIIQGYPELSDEDIRAAVAYAASVVQDEEIRFIAPAA
ncbi:MAG: DUF433 domain-containing protein [Nitrospirae bacterium]|nr:DUF433 domain-containing protein [Nitrospirota bacterium]